MKIIGVKGDAEIRSIQSAYSAYGEDIIDAFLDGEDMEDQEGNLLWPVFSTDEDAYDQTCAGCLHLLGDCTCGE